MVVTATNGTTIQSFLKTERTQQVAFEERAFTLTRRTTTTVAQVAVLTGEGALDGGAGEGRGAGRDDGWTAACLALLLRHEVVRVRVAVEHEWLTRQRIDAEEPAHFTSRRDVIAACDVAGLKRK